MNIEEGKLQDILSAADIHPFSLLVIKDSLGRYLLKKNKRWNTFLLPFSCTKATNDFIEKNF